MPADVVIDAVGLTKRYRLGASTSPGTLVEAAGAWSKRIIRRERVVRQQFAALTNVGFQINAGEAVGIVGSNGAGKTTLLKLLSRVTRPTEGEIRIRGRVGSLLEVGAGFHPELSGRENIYMNGAMLGMRRREIDSRFADIVEFAGVSTFLETPVKRYSSGMYVRLAFSVAAHLEPEILLIDEVLAVGDVAFQRKCLGKMGEVASGGRTVLFVSHNLAAVQQLTSRSILLESGQITAEGPTSEVVERYMRGVTNREGRTFDFTRARRPDESLTRDVELLSGELDGDAAGTFASDGSPAFLLEVRANRDVPEFRFSLSVMRYEGTAVGSGFSRNVGKLRAGETGTYRLELPPFGLAPGRYHVTLATGIGDTHTGHRHFDIVLNVLDFEVAAPAASDGSVTTWEHNWGPIRIPAPEVRRL